MYFDWEKAIYMYQVQLFLLYYNFCARSQLRELRYNNGADLHRGRYKNSNVFQVYINNNACDLGTRPRH